MKVDGTCPLSGLGAPGSPAGDREGKAKSIGQPRWQDGRKRTEVQANVPDPKSQVQEQGVAVCSDLGHGELWARLGRREECGVVEVEW